MPSPYEQEQEQTTRGRPAAMSGEEQEASGFPIFMSSVCRCGVFYIDYSKIEMNKDMAKCLFYVFFNIFSFIFVFLVKKFSL